MATACFQVGMVFRRNQQTSQSRFINPFHFVTAHPFTTEPGDHRSLNLTIGLCKSKVRSKPPSIILSSNPRSPSSPGVPIVNATKPPKYETAHQTRFSVEGRGH